MIVLRMVFVMLVVALPLTAQGEHSTLNALAKAYDDGACKSCHGKIHKEWTSSYHSQSVVHSLGGLRNYIVVGVGKEYDQPMSKEHLMRCMGCHAPQIKDASEKLAREIADLVITAKDSKSKSKRNAALKKLSKLNVNCIVCHNTMIKVEKNVRGDPTPGIYYGPKGGKSKAHGTDKTPEITRSIYCGQCHGIYTPPDGDTIGCNTLYGSYQDAFRGNGGSETCQDCHMKKKNRGHTFPGAYEVDIVREGIGLDVQAIGIKLHPGKWIPTAVVNVGLINRAGHRIPDG